MSIFRKFKTAGLEKKYKILGKLDTPQKIQNFLNKIPFNDETKRPTDLSPMMVLEKKTCHCLEGGVLAALALRVQGYPPLLVDLKANDYDDDHILAVFQKFGKWGAITKTNHAGLRYREPVYNSIRELAMSFFHEYFDNDGSKNLVSYSRVVNLKRFDKQGWMTTREEISYIPKYMDKVRHYPMLDEKQRKNLRKADQVEIKAANIYEWSPRGRYNQALKKI